jgi:CHAD domain-containing protein
MSPSQGLSTPTFSRAATLLLEMLDLRSQKFLVCFTVCQSEFSKEAVHDLRVASRRLLTLLEIIESLFLGMKGRKLRRELKRQLDCLDELMDTQVQIAFVEQKLAQGRGVAAFIKYLLHQQAGLQKQVEHTIRAVSIAKQARSLADIRQTAESGLQIPDMRIRLIGAADRLYENVLNRFARIDPGQTETIHRTRIAFKSFRYAVEIIHPLLARYPAQLLKAMNDYQGLMGDIQDMEVMQNMLDAFSKAQPGVDISSPLAVVEEYHRLKVTAYLSKKDSLHMFWRLSPRQPYPWSRVRPPIESAPVKGIV